MTENETIKSLEYVKHIVVFPEQGEKWSANRETIAIDIAIKALEEIQQYREIGTVEEFREAMERQRGKKPVKDKYNHDCCPDCGWIVYKDEYGGRYLPHCENCGQAISWEEEN